MTNLVLLLAAGLAAPADDTRLAGELYSRTEYRRALEVLENSAARDRAEALALSGQCWYQLGDFKRAVDAFEKAAEADPRKSKYQDWLGRAYGRRAETSNPFSAPGLAVKARAAFERAVELDPSNIEAMNDLFSYYLEAPGFLGGGLEKAEALAARMKAANAAESHVALARLAERRKQPDIAERQLRRAVELAPRSAHRLVDLARFLARQGRHGESDQAFQRARKAEPANRQVLFVQAETYVESNRNLPQARVLLEEYLRGPLTSDDPSRESALNLIEKTR